MKRLVRCIDSQHIVLLELIWTPRAQIMWNSIPHILMSCLSFYHTYFCIQWTSVPGTCKVKQAVAVSIKSEQFSFLHFASRQWHKENHYASNFLLLTSLHSLTYTQKYFLFLQTPRRPHSGCGGSPWVPGLAWFDQKGKDISMTDLFPVPS